MTTPPRPIEIRCPTCGVGFQSWHRASINLDLEEWTEAEIEEATTATCPNCGTTIPIETLVLYPLVDQPVRADPARMSVNLVAVHLGDLTVPVVCSCPKRHGMVSII